ncbi:GNAT family N-acetyltransferase [Clostridium sp. 'White wine YQ']|uniref:GNAT family N-acetyltransferase n=1 Tax=Clostridium sp. 'White wine YQ' TaxID=3027474 RepID=UPI00236705A0|nr:GNAT family N-acetyltransferase [Clostridium sp. 'White wine YQ']MDD7794500.1 GNAT family N-acetyltransferase [Clostridium sp. 'White wine YQ']
MNLEIIKTDSKNSDFIMLINELDKDLRERNGEIQDQYDKHNKIDNVNDVVIIYVDKKPVACGAFKEYNTETAELKRIFVLKSFRGQGFSKLLVNSLEELSSSKGYKYAILETGRKHIEAINLYKRSGYTITENYDPYIGMTESICMKKNL